MADRFKDAQWYIGGGDELSAIIYDASDPDGPNGHGEVCRHAVIEDARLIAAAPELLRIVKTLLEGYGGIIPPEVRFEARQAIAKTEPEGK